MRLSQPVCTLVDAPRNRCTLRAAPLDRCITQGSAPQTPCTASLRCSLLDYGICYKGFTSWSNIFEIISKSKLSVVLVIMVISKVHMLVELGFMLG